MSNVKLKCSPGEANFYKKTDFAPRLPVWGKWDIPWDFSHGIPWDMGMGWDGKDFLRGFPWWENLWETFREVSHGGKIFTFFCSKYPMIA